MKKVKITVMKTTFQEDLALRYGRPGLKPCSYHTEGSVFYSNGWQKPARLCDNAWKSMQEYVMTLACGGTDFYDGWMLDRNTALIGCNDGFRTVIFLLEATDEIAPVWD